MLEISAFVNCCFLCSVMFMEYYSTMHCSEVMQTWPCQVDSIYSDIFGPVEQVPIYGLSINLQYIYKIVPALVLTGQLDVLMMLCSTIVPGKEL